MKITGKIIGITAVILTGTLIVCFTNKNLKNMQKSYDMKTSAEDTRKENRKNGKEPISSYQEMIMPYNTKNYYHKTGIWKTMLDTDGKLCSYAENDNTNKYMLISWNHKKQIEKVFPSAKTVPKKLIKGYPMIIPYSDGKSSGYIMYRKNSKGFLCYYLGKKGKPIQEISLQSFLEQEIKNGSMESDSYGIVSMEQIKKNRIAVGIAEWTDTGYAGDSCWLFDINVKKNKLISVEKCDYWLVGADSSCRYGIEIEENGYFRSGMDFANGHLIIEDRKNGKQVAMVEIPNDIISENNESVSQCIDIRDGVVWFANRTGVYRLKAGDLKWTMVMQPEQSSYLNQNYSLSDITAVDENTFCLLLLEGEDDESSTILVKYTAV